uniref:DUF6297 family protein n=1 Tax=Nocardioides alcanivorans TaxID=2897352 RepID=UPI0024B22AEC
TGSDCASARELLPWLVVGATLAALWAVARMLGPIAVSPGIASWLVPTPVDRGELLRRRVWGMAALSSVVVAPVAAAAATLAGFGVQSLLLLTIGSAGLAAFGTGSLVHAQSRRRHPALLLGPLCLLAVGVGLAAIASEHVPEMSGSSRLDAFWLGTAALLWLGLLAVLLRASSLAGRLRRRDVAPGGALVPGLGGALASLDLALLFDVVLAHGSRAAACCAPAAVDPPGVLALVWRDVIRLRRHPGKVALLFGSLLVPYAVAAVGGESPLSWSRC